MAFDGWMMLMSKRYSVGTLKSLGTEVPGALLWQRVPARKEKQELAIQRAGGKRVRKNSSSSRYMKSARELWLPHAFSAFLEGCHAEV